MKICRFWSEGGGQENIEMRRLGAGCGEKEREGGKGKKGEE